MRTPAVSDGQFREGLLDADLEDARGVRRDLVGEPVAASRPEGEQLLLQRHWEGAEEVAIPQGRGGHGGGDAILLMDVFRRDLRVGDDPLGRAAGFVDGVRAIAVGVAANRSLETGQAVLVDDLDLGTALTR